MKTKSNIASEFDEFSVNYTEDMTKCVPYYQKLLSSFTENFSPTFNPKKILDLGCGNGNVTAQLLQSFPNAQYELLDASREMITLCKKRFSEYSISYHTSFFNDFHFNKNTYDLVVAGFSLHHCSAIEKEFFFKKIYDSLNHDGVFGCSDLMIDKNNPKHSLLLKDWEAFVLKNYPNSEKWEWLMEHYEAFDRPDSLENQLKWLQNAGFKKIEPMIYDEYWVYFMATKS